MPARCDGCYRRAHIIRIRGVNLCETCAPALDWNLHRGRNVTADMTRTITTQIVDPTELIDRGQAVVYTMYDNNGHIIYIGITNNISRRINEHGKQSNWFVNVATVRWTQSKPRERCEVIEAIAVHTIKPKFNVNVETMQVRQSRIDAQQDEFLLGEVRETTRPLCSLATPESRHCKTEGA